MSHYNDERYNEAEKTTKKAPVKRKKKVTKPIKIVDYTKLDAMCAIHCTGEECASVLGMDYDTLNAALKRDGNKGFSDYFKVKGANGKMSLRRKQYDQAMSGNATMLIWLGKQWLNQSDKVEERRGNIDGETLKTDNKWTVEFVNAES
jgi:hypothetical protein